jgi:hypothetical protein
LSVDVLPLDSIRNSTLAIGLRKLKSAYTGPALRLRRSSDNQEQDFGFAGVDLNVSAINAWLNGASGYCSVLYDQSGNGAHVIQQNPYAQPIFVASGINNKPILHFNTSMRMNNNVNYTPPYSAIYGSRAAGGVVLITTKRGKEGKGQFQYDVQYGLNQLSNKVKLLNAEQFTQLLIDGHNNSYKDLILNSGKTWTNAMYSDDNATRVAKVGNASSVSLPPDLYDFANQKMITPKYNTDWQDELYQTSMVQRHNLSFTGGNGSTRYAISGGYLSQPGIIKSTKKDRINFRANVDGQVSSKLRVAANLAITTN